MLDLDLVHFSDLHFGARGIGLAPSLAVTRALKACSPYLDETPRVLAISGDITHQGATTGFAEARQALLEQSDTFPQESIVMCPGNHDIVGGSFHDFNRFAFQVTNDPRQVWSDDTPVVSVRRHGYRFILVNSYYQGDYTRGSVPLEHLKRSLAEAPASPIVVIVHDSPISSSYGGQSLIDGYDFLDAVSRAHAVAAVHGHVHSDQALRVGEMQTVVAGAGSLSFPPDPNMNNHFAIYQFRDGRAARALAFRYYANRGEFVGTLMEGFETC